jgi:hypothetical protein
VLGNIAIGYQAGASFQRTNAIAIGYKAGSSGQGNSSIAIGNFSGFDPLFDTTQKAGDNTIILNASTAAFSIDQIGALYINPIRLRSATNWAATDASGVLVYNTVKKEVAVNTAKTFVIDHPTKNDRYLVHACLEGPESGVYYRGESEIVNNESVKVFLPDYAKNLVTDFTIQVTPIYSGAKLPSPLQTSRIKDNSFMVYGNNTKFNWLVQGKRSDVIVEPLKTNINVKGDGPYRWI